MHPLKRLCALAGCVVIAAEVGGQPAGLVAQDKPSAAVMELLEGTWELDEWHVDGKVLKPPIAVGRLSHRDGVVMNIMHRTDTGESVAAYGVYKVNASTWSYGYVSRLTAKAPRSGPPM